MNTKRKFNYLKQINLFKGLSDQQIMSIAGEVVEIQYEKSELILIPNTELNGLSIIKYGKINLYHLNKGKKHIFDILESGDVFGDILNSSKSKNNIYIEADEKTKICTFRKEHFLKVIKQHPELFLNLLEQFANRINKYELHTKSNILNAKEKVLHFLNLHSRKYLNNQKADLKSSKITHEKLSQLTGLSRETVTRVVGKLKNEGIKI